MDQRVTQCPRCGTSFRVTEAHLAVAAGAVRCGSCLHIFNAREHWADEPAAAPAAAANPGHDLDNLDDDLLIDDNTPLFGDDEDEDKSDGGSIFSASDDDFGEFREANGPEKLSDTFLDLNSWEQDTGPTFSATAASDGSDDDSPAADEQWASRLLEEDDELDIAARNAPARPAIFEDYGALLDGMPETDEHRDNPAEDTDEELLDIPDFVPGGRQAPGTAAAAAVNDDDDDDDETNAAPGETIDLSLTPLRAGDRIGAERPLFGSFEAEPLQLHQFIREPRWPKVAWSLGLVAALLLLAGQYLYFNFDTLARGQMRPWLVQVCAVFSCEVPAQSDVARIRTGSLMVRSHPSHRGALAVDAIITNQAPFAQPYPVLQLQFSDLNGAPVAARQFGPDEYLAGELTGSRLMPVQQPVHIALELVDPGPRAVNYQLTVAAPTTPAQR